MSSTQHVCNQCNVYEFPFNTHYHVWCHEALTADEQRRKMWLTPGSPAHDALCKVVKDKRLVKYIMKTTNAVHTAPFE